MISNEMEELIGYRPHWIIRKGNFLFLLILISLLAFTWIIKFPDRIRGPIRIVAVNMPQPIAAKMDAKLKKLLISNEDEVAEGQPLVVLEENNNQYVLAATQPGKIFFNSTLQQGQLVTVGQELFYLQPHTQYYGEMKVPQAGFGKINKGQKVLIRLDSYPSLEFGYLTGYVNLISMSRTTKDGFLITVELQKELQSSYKKTFVLGHNLSGNAEVLTDERRLFDRFFGQWNQFIK